jgi:CheY-like chemotaxis protein
VSPRPPVVLVVDDYQEGLALCALGLLAMGFHVITAANGEDGLARAWEIRPDAIVTDVELPGISGLELTRRLRDDARTQTAGIIVLTGSMSGPSQRSAHEAGCDRLLLKPCSPDALGLQIHEVLARRAGA